MRTAALYDIHGNLPALEAVLADVQAEGIERVIVGGDVIAGPFPAASLRALRALPVPTLFIRGNAESETLRAAAGQPPGGFSERADGEARWLAETLSPDDLRWITSWPLAVEIESPGRVLFCHATPESDSRVFTSRTPEAAIAPAFVGVDCPTVVCGHTHLPFDRRIAGRRVINAGSVGMPFGQTGADWLVLGPEGIAFRHTDYDLAAAAERIRASEYPHAASLAQNNVERVPSADQALAMLEQLQASQAA
ncbi:metallophosphoesterase family protein [Rubricoccus marinus]|uniref:Calcineurin-like phosphoesterase domain-containing protein n=1 Tax=Rubricoccus marinus TaxID=716817 RepID=A0A259TVF6_9BACT|nr:metallophosphoesterase family protein [Rubricoccus marinus]OZC01711.1 hypothetical protein BSZ36_01155 [Rubricoccus marinus]